MNDTIHNKPTFIQWVLFLFGTIFIGLAVYFVIKTNTGLAGWTLFLAVALIIIGAVNPESIKELGWRQGKSGPELTFKRDILTMAQAQKAPIIEKNKQLDFIADESLVEAAEKRESDPKSAADYLQLAKTALLENNYDDGLQYAYSGLSLNPEDKRIKATLEHRIGTLFEKIQTNASAEGYYNKAVDTDPTFFWPHNNLGNLAADRGANFEAESEYRKAIALDPDSYGPHYNLGNLLMAQGRNEEAEEAFRNAISLNPEYSDSHHNLGTLIARLGRMGEAEEAFRKAISLNPNFALFYYNLGTLLSKQGRNGEAEEAYRKAIELDPENAIAQNNLGILMAQLDRLEDAQVAFRKAITLDPEYRLPHYNLGVLLNKQGHIGDAEQHFAKAKSLEED